MAIEEKQRALEFTFVPDDISGDLKYDIIYDESNPVFPLQVSTGGSRIDYPLDLFIDVVEFLTVKGIIKPKAYSRTVMTPGSTLQGTRPSPSIPTPPSSGIPMPHVIRGDGVDTPSQLTSNTDPLASFDITGDAPKIPIPNILKTEKAPSEKFVPSGNTPPLPTIVKSGSAGPVVGVVKSVDPVMMPDVMPSTESPIEPSSVSSEIISRPVIRSRVTGGDPQSAEKEAAALRAATGKGAGKTIRKAHREE